MQFEKILNNGVLYNIFQRVIKNKKGINSYKNYFSHSHNLPNKNIIKVLDIGCGHGTSVPYLYHTDYTGIDINEGNIILAKRKYVNFPNMNFIAGNVSEYILSGKLLENTFDIVFMNGVLHHLSREIINSILSQIPKLIKENGVFQSIDPVYTKNQPKISKWLMSHDRGKYILELDEYLMLLKDYFPVLKYKIETDLFRFPFPYPLIQSWGYLCDKE